MQAVVNVRLEQRRQAVIDVLTEQFSQDRIAMDDYERLVASAQQANDLMALAQVEDQVPETALAPARETAPVAAEDIQHLSAFMAERRLGGNWLRGKAVAAFTCMASQVFDFREVSLPPGELRLELFVLMGDARIIVPEDLAVRMEAVPIMADAAVGKRVSTRERAGSPVLVVCGNAIMGSIKVDVK